MLQADNDGEGGDPRAARARAAGSCRQRGRLRRCLDRARPVRRGAALRRRRDHAGHLGAVGGRGARGRARRSSRASSRSRSRSCVGLFLIQRRGTGRVGRVFGPVMLVWFVVLALLGIGGIVRAPARAARPRSAARRRASSPSTGARRLLVLGAVVLSLTGGEALYADMGHFGRRPIRVGVVLRRDAGAGAQLLRPGRARAARPEAAENPFFLLAPDWALQLPLVVLATVRDRDRLAGAHLGRVLADQAGGAARLPAAHADRAHVRNAARARSTSPSSTGALLLAGASALVIGFGSSTNLAAAYGIAVATRWRSRPSACCWWRACAGTGRCGGSRWCSCR